MESSTRKGRAFFIMDKLVRTLGSEKLKDFNEHFDKLVDKYRQIANASGYTGELKFKKEKGKKISFQSSRFSKLAKNLFKLSKSFPDRLFLFFLMINIIWQSFECYLRKSSPPETYQNKSVLCETRIYGNYNQADHEQNHTPKITHRKSSSRNIVVLVWLSYFW
jgi:hypothetical protein